jgi:hypothetical protein
MMCDFEFRCLVGVNSVKCYREVQAGGNARTVLTGKWNKKLEWLSPKQPGWLAADFANATDVLSFTKAYGPLDNLLPDFTGKLAPNSPQIEDHLRMHACLPPFEFIETEWSDRQKQFRQIWEILPEHLPFGSSNMFPGIVGIEDLVVTRNGFRLPVRGEFSLVADRLIFRAATLWELLLLDLCSVGRKKLRKCGCPECKRPHFVGRSNAKFCEDKGCKKWGRNQTKLKWWNANRT